MKPKLQQSIIKFIAEARIIEGAEDGIFEISKEYENCVILTGEIYGKETNDKINELGRAYGLSILARDLNILYEKPNLH